MKTIRYTKITKLKEYKEKKLIIEKFLFHLHFYHYFADADGDEIVFKTVKNLYERSLSGNSDIAHLFMSRGIINFEFIEQLKLKVTWKVDFTPSIFLSLFVAIFFSLGYFYFTSPNWLNAGILFSSIFAFLLPLSYIAVRLKIAFHNNSVV